MNVNDTEILNSIMTKTGYVRTDNLDEAHVVFLVTVSKPKKKKSHSKKKPFFLLVCNSR